MASVSKNINDSLRIMWKLWRSFMHELFCTFRRLTCHWCASTFFDNLQEVWVQPKLSSFQQHSIQQYELWIRIILPSYCCGAITVEVGSVAFNHLVTSLNSHIMSSCSCMCALGWAQWLPKLPKLPKLRTRTIAPTQTHRRLHPLPFNPSLPNMLQYIAMNFNMDVESNNSGPLLSGFDQAWKHSRRFAKLLTVALASGTALELEKQLEVRLLLEALVEDLVAFLVEELG